MFEKRKIKELRKILEKELSLYRGSKKIKLNIDASILDKILFSKQYDKNRKLYKTFAINFFKIKKLDFSDISFDNVNIEGMNFCDSKGIKINPQTIYNKSMYATDLNNVEFIGPFDDVEIYRADFGGSKGAKINPQTIQDKLMWGTKLADVEFIGPFDDVKIAYADFRRSKGAIIDPQIVFEKDLRLTNLTDTTITGTFEGTKLLNTLYNNEEIKVKNVRKNADQEYIQTVDSINHSFEKVLTK